MKESRKKFLTAMGLLAMVALLAFPALVLAQPDTSAEAAATDQAHAGAAGMHPGAHFAMHGLIAKLNLTDAQKAAAKQLFQDMKAKMAPVHQAQQQLHTQLQAALAAPNPDAAAVGQLVITMHQNRAQLKPVMDAFQQQFQALLNPDQQAKYKQLLADHPFFRHFQGDPTSTQ
jgi:Spy/CpxP family protein refolding chaperone